MKNLDTFQKNCIVTGTGLAAEIPSTSSELRAFVEIGSYTKTLRGAAKPSKFLNVDDSNLRFWIRKYEARKKDIENDLDITQDELINSIYVNDIQSIEDLEAEIGKYLGDFSLLQVKWKVDAPF